MLLVAFGTTILAGCQSTPSASNTPSGSETPAISTTPAVLVPRASTSPAVSTTPLIVKSPATSTSPTVSTTPGIASSSQSSNNIKKAEAALKDLYSQQAGVAIDSVKCPENANLKTGGTFECQAKAEGIDFGIQVKIENEQGKVDTRPTGVLILKRVEELLQKSIKEKVKFDVTADCGSKKLRAAKSEDTFTCQVKDAKGQSKEATVTVKDGTISVKI